MSEDSVVVDALLQMCYPTAHHSTENLDTLLDVLSAARKYGMKKVEQIIRDTWPSVLEADPLRSYLTAAQYGWVKEARACADELVSRYDIPSIRDKYHTDMESIANAPYRRLLLFVEDRIKAATGPHQLRIASKLRCQRSDADDRGLLETSGSHSGCSARYPSTFTTAVPPQWLVPTLTPFVAALGAKSDGSAIASHTEVGRAFVCAAAADTVPCTNTEKCNAAERVAWAFAIIEQYAQAVDIAVKKASA
ncbi:hypothetical protein BV20DRAFT_1055139 [Pilatotrama ljubarskyi]|nr:hypothetical protein BV20DRAFT_1055139 [Pilatotrama ljubarskyi]